MNKENMSFIIIVSIYYLYLPRNDDDYDFNFKISK